MVYLHVFRDEITVLVQTSVFSVMIKITDNMLTVYVYFLARVLNGCWSITHNCPRTMKLSETVI